jgi:hypothetical protein
MDFRIIHFFQRRYLYRMKKRSNLIHLLSFFLLICLFVALFYRQFFGINVLIYSVVVLGVFHAVNSNKVLNRLDYFIQIGFFLSAIMLVLHNNYWSVWVNFLFGTALVGRLSMVNVKSILHSFSMGVHSFFFSFSNLARSGRAVSVRGISFKRLVRLFRVVLIPTFIILLFILVYSLASPEFLSFFRKFDWMFERLAKLIGQIDFQFIALLFLAILFHSGLLFFGRSKVLEESAMSGHDTMARRSDKKVLRSRPMDLLVEYRSGLYLLTTLNLLLCFVNFFDIKRVWLNFSWQGEYLKGYVHHGTYMLLLSIIVSIIIVLYYFRGNLNFYKGNRSLKILSTVWLIQNAILTLSVGGRTLQYIKHFNLAYKRVALLFFLLLVLVAIVTVLLKIRDKKTSYFLTRTNGLAWGIVLLCSTLVDWSGYIARYNLDHKQHSFVHFEFLSNLPDACLDDLSISEQDAMALDTIRVEPEKLKQNYMLATEFRDELEERREAFLDRYPSQNWLSWNLAEYLTYRRLKP